MKQYLRGVTYVLLAIVFLAAASVSTVAAQSSTVGITPAFPSEENPRTAAIFIHTIKPGESASDGILVVNNTKETRTVNLGVVDSSASVDGSFSCKQNTEKQTKVGTWISLEKKSVELAAGTNEIVKLAITVPKDAGPGEHGGCITAQDTKSYGAKKGSGVLLGFRSAVRVAITVPGKIVKELSIVRIETKRLAGGNYSVSPVAKNSGNVSLDVQTRAQLVSKLGQQTPIKDDAKYPIMPGATMGWPYVFERPFWGGFYRARVSISYNANPADGLGENMGAVKKVRAESGYFFMIPAPQAMAVYAAAVLLLVGLPLWRLRKRRIRKGLNTTWQAYTVQLGDTLAGLAATHGVRWKKIAKVNHLKAPYVLSEGQEMLLPRLVPSKQTWEAPAAAPERPKKSVVAPEKPQVEAAPSSSQEADTWQAPGRTPARVIYAPRPTGKTQKSTSQKSVGGYSWASPSSAWAPRVVSEDELEQIALSRHNQRHKTTKRKKTKPDNRER